MSASITPIGGPTSILQADPLDVAATQIRQARAITDLISVVDVERLFPETLGWATYTICELLEAAADTVDERQRALKP